MYCLELAGEDDAFAAREAEAAAEAVEVVAPGLATAASLDPARMRTLAYTHAASDVVARSPADVTAAREALAAAPLDTAVTEPGRPRGAAGAGDVTVAVRARDVRGTAGVSTSAAERALGTVLVDRGYAVDLDDPDRVLRAVFSGDTCVLGWLVVEADRAFGDRRPTDRPFFQPGSMAPMDARAFANIAGAGPGATLLDPMCGTGGVLIEAGLVGADVVGTDAQRKMVRGARRNLRAALHRGAPSHLARADATVHLAREDATVHLARADATRLPLRDDTVDGVVFDAPYGRQSKIAQHPLADLVGGALAEARRVVGAGGRDDPGGHDDDPVASVATPPSPLAVVVGDRPWRTEAEAAGWTVERVFERRVHRSLTRHVHVLRGD